MRQAITYRANRKELAKMLGIEFDPLNTKVGPGRRNKWLMRHPKVAGFYGMAIRVLQNGDRAQAPKWKAIRKMMVALAVSPRIKMFGVGDRVPVILMQARHERGRVRSYPHVVIDANLTVAS